MAGTAKKDLKNLWLTIPSLGRGIIIVIAGGIIVWLVIVIIKDIIKYFNKPPKATPPPDTQAPGTDNFDPKPYTDAIYNDIYSGVLTAHTAKPYNDVLDLSNTYVVDVWNDWRARYYSKDGQTISQALDGESTTFNFAWINAKNNLIDRFKSLNLT